jgi:hypothetical protein
VPDVEAAARAQPSPAGPVYTRQQPEGTALYHVMREHLLTFEQKRTDEASGEVSVVPDETLGGKDPLLARPLAAATAGAAPAGPANQRQAIRIVLRSLVVPKPAPQAMASPALVRAPPGPDIRPRARRPLHRHPALLGRHATE